MNNYKTKAVEVTSIIVNAIVFTMFILKISLGFDLGFGLGDIVYYFSIFAITIFVMLYIVLIYKQKISSNFYIHVCCILLGIYHVYILTFGEGVEGKGWFD